MQEQVLKNAQDIFDYRTGAQVLNQFGIKVIGKVDTPEQLPDPTTFTIEDIGNAYAVGTETPYDLYIITRPFENQEELQWFGIGQFPVPGPQGEQGIQGVQGDTGPRGSKWYVSAAQPTGDVKSGDVWLNPGTGLVKYLIGTNWTTQGSIMGPQGVQGEKGETGATGNTGPQGPKGDKGDTGGIINLVGRVDNAAGLPSVDAVGYNDAYAVGTTIPYDIYTIITEPSRQWLNIGSLNPNIVQESGQSPSSVMSQKATTDYVDDSVTGLAAWSEVEEAIAEVDERPQVKDLDARVTNLEEAASDAILVEFKDNDQAYQIDLPANILPKAKITKIGGDVFGFNKSLLGNYQMRFNNPDGNTLIALNNMTEEAYPSLTNMVLGHKYYCYLENKTSKPVRWHLDTTNYSKQISISTGTTKEEITEPVTSANYLVIDRAIVANDMVKAFHIDLTSIFGAGNEPETASDERVKKLKAYALSHPNRDEGSEVIVNPQSVEIVGSNIALTETTNTTNGITLSCDNNHITIKGTCTTSGWSKSNFRVYLEPSTTYHIKVFGNLPGLVFNNSAIASGYNQNYTFTTPPDFISATFQINCTNGTTYNLDGYIMIVKGDSEPNVYYPPHDPVTILSDKIAKAAQIVNGAGYQLADGYIDLEDLNYKTPYQSDPISLASVFDVSDKWINVEAYGTVTYNTSAQGQPIDQELIYYKKGAAQ